MVVKGSNLSPWSKVNIISIIFIVDSGKKCQSSKQRRELTSQFSNSFKKPAFVRHGDRERNSSTES